MIKKLIWGATCSVAWIGRLLCRHPSPKWEGNGLTLNGHHDGQAETFWHCLKCGKRYTTRGHYEGDQAQAEAAYMEGAEAFIAHKSILANPYRPGDPGYQQWRRGYSLEKDRFGGKP